MRSLSIVSAHGAHACPLSPTLFLARRRGQRVGQIGKNDDDDDEEQDNPALSTEQQRLRHGAREPNYRYSLDLGRPSERERARQS